MWPLISQHNVYMQIYNNLINHTLKVCKKSKPKDYEINDDSISPLILVFLHTILGGFFFYMRQTLDSPKGESHPPTPKPALIFKGVGTTEMTVALYVCRVH